MTSPFGPLVAIAEMSASPRMREELSVLERTLRTLGLEHTVELAERPGAAEPLAAAAIADGARFVVAVGDDRTVLEVVNGIMAAREVEGDPPVLGVVPSGAGSDLTLSFGLPRDVEGACAHLAGANTYPLDLMRVVSTTDGGGREARYAANLAEVGMGGEIGRRIPRGTSNVRRFSAFWSAWARSAPSAVRVSVDTKSWEGRAFNVIVGNGQFTSGGLRMSPRSFPGDGILDALIFTGPRSDAYTMLPKIYRHGDHVPDPRIKEMRAKIRVSVEGERPLAVVADGVPMGRAPVTFEVVPRALRLKL